MNYKKIIRSRSIRFKILTILNWIPDRIMLRIQYRIKMGFWPDFNHPKRFTEKMQLYKMKYRNPLMSQCVDKYEVRQYVERKGLGHILNELYGVYDTFEDINFEKLPKQFVIKSTTGGGGLNVIVIRDKTKIDIERIKSDIASWGNHKKGHISSGREWAYTGMGKSRIIIEKYLEDSSEVKGDSLSDYKMMFFDGQFKSLWVDKDRYSNHKRGFWDEKLQFLYGVSSDHETFTNPPTLPDNIQEMINIGKVLSEDFPYARIDLYNVEGKIYFGEITFYPWSGYVTFHPDSYDFKLGQFFTKYT